MKILSINNTADIYGASKCLLRLLRRFVQAGHQVYVVLPHEGPLRTLLEQEGISVFVCSDLSIVDRSSFSSPAGMLRFLLSIPRSSLWLMRLIRRFEIDVVHTNTAVLPTPAIAARLTGRAHAWHIREFFFEFGPVWKIYERFMLQFANTVIAVSECVKAQFSSGVRDRVTVIYDGLEVTADPTLGERAAAFRLRFPAANPLVGVVGRIKWHRKGQEVLVKAAGLLKAKLPTAHYVIIGSSTPENLEHTERLKALVHDLDLEDHVTFVGEITDIAAVQAALDISVVPSIQAEPFGMVVVESMEQHTAVIGSRCGGIQEQIVDEVSGLLFPPGDEVALSRAIDRLSNDPAERQRIAEEGYRRVQRKFLMETTFTETEALFAELAAGRKLALTTT